jgi:hypothetical protein
MLKEDISVMHYGVTTRAPDGICSCARALNVAAHFRGMCKLVHSRVQCPTGLTHTSSANLSELDE